MICYCNQALNDGDKTNCILSDIEPMCVLCPGNADASCDGVTGG